MVILGMRLVILGCHLADLARSLRSFFSIALIDYFFTYCFSSFTATLVDAHDSSPP